ncbi:homoprotocatechuate degradation operon regulator HpaR [Pseudoteredinibacter isoporae]|uniref:Homoprotocatechuate degradation regulator HpaR n=1 Tax=Pseudoteredinibacter isoporae TaxID=570281 RepID=A0A7X0MX99_9GAMM|nr:homoprotocatechuate degradation operon regulator HpaR [Pseudoteredinibacter isoporae]MBB6523050.1 homoprotocatechuate degradation regulator HpaR [Pseudoteredinibacter isoporae]NHO88570.1 homoprotocatechuate degradation operon regulator HpaR [Pseudoteredinibacter isoporae]NIB22739.1 homoprotocatechuate degradation operon regulator HpaR [Pseudoteredinibacter isoporae]
MSERLRSFDRSLPMSLLRAREAVMKKFMPALKAHNLSAQQWRVIRALEAAGDLDISELSEACYLLMPSLSRIIQNLESRGIVLRKSSSSDQRRSLISLTEAGRDIFIEIAPKSSERYEFISERFGPGKLELLYELLEELVEKIEEGEAS